MLDFKVWVYIDIHKILEYSPKIIIFCDEAGTKEWTDWKSDRTDWGSRPVTLGKQLHQSEFPFPYLHNKDSRINVGYSIEVKITCEN